MSFILDALKKSEAERRRQTGPTLYEMRAAPRRTALPVWVVVLLVALGLNLLVLGYLLIRKPAAPSDAAAPVVAPPAPPVPAIAAPPLAAPPVAAPVAALPPEQGPYRAPAQAPLPEPVYVPPEPIVAVPRPVAPPATAASRPADGGPIASLADMRGTGGTLPDLRMSLHVYDADPARRYLLLNGQRLREGDVMPDGLRVERITEDGAVLGWRGRRFLLPRGE